MSTTTVWILGDQLLADHPAIAHAEAQTSREHLRILLIESRALFAHLPHHRKRRVLVISAMRHYAQRLREQGYTVDLIHAETMHDGLRQHTAQYAPKRLITMASANLRGRALQNTLSDLLGIVVEVLPNTQFLVGRHNPFPDTDKNVIQETFYRAMRRNFNVLMDGAQPIGGAWNFDHDNRKPLPKTERAPALLSLTPDAITQQVIAEVESSSYGGGTATDFAYAVTHEDAQRALEQFIAERLVKFGPYEDAMSSTQDTLYHAVLSPYINIGLLTPMQMIRAAERVYYEDGAPINSVEGFIRQVLGWREYMVWQYWRRGDAWQTDNAWDAQRQMPSFFWTGDTRMNCLKHIITRLHDSAYTHHIERLMIVSNFCLLAGVHPQAVVNWFMEFYIDAYDWVMQPNVVGMGLNADGGATATKPYIASANYINKMSDYCKGCGYNHKARIGADACPFNTLYWNFLIDHEAELRGNPRLGPAVLGLRHLYEDERAQVQGAAEMFLKHM